MPEDRDDSTPRRVPPDWAPAVIGFLSRSLPRDETGEGWDHMFMTAYQTACEALVALGQAEETARGIVARKPPRRPAVPPRWDDICVAVLWLAEQHNRLVYYTPDGRDSDHGIVRAGDIVWKIVGAPPAPRPTVLGDPALGPAFADPEALSVLRALGLIVDGRWAAAAETVLWRCHPQPWGLDIESEPRFLAAVERACEAMPSDVRQEIERLGCITEADVTAALARSVAGREELRAKLGPKARVDGPETRDQARRGLAFQRQNELDWLFYRRWRLADGWLAPADAARALEIFNDPLASMMRRAVVARLHPASRQKR